MTGKSSERGKQMIPCMMKSHDRILTLELMFSTLRHSVFYLLVADTPLLHLGSINNLYFPKVVR